MRPYAVTHTWLTELYGAALQHHMGVGWYVVRPASSRADEAGGGPMSPVHRCGHLESEHEDYDAKSDYIASGRPNFAAAAVTLHACPTECENDLCPAYKKREVE